ncbi:hypothetical protein DYH55_21605 [Methylovirgula sp. 4M-Z18]|nr:hypothetical protein DYH55_21605 [Methylovirgula sp. 4M-Z18]
MRRRGPASASSLLPQLAAACGRSFACAWTGSAPFLPLTQSSHINSAKKLLVMYAFKVKGGVLLEDALMLWGRQ